MGNLRSVQKAVDYLGHPCTVRSEVGDASRLIIPGVGAFGAAMDRLAPLADSVRDFAASGRPLLGLCLGQQLLFESSEEHGSHAGLAVLRGHVRYLRPSAGNKVPNIGWCPVEPSSRSRLFEGIAAGTQFYFVHSLYTECEDADDVAATSLHTNVFAAAVEHGNVWATQFHPEKSGAPGLRLLENFLRC